MTFVPRIRKIHDWMRSSRAGVFLRRIHTLLQVCGIVYLKNSFRLWLCFAKRRFISKISRKFQPGYREALSNPLSEVMKNGAIGFWSIEKDINRLYLLANTIIAIWEIDETADRFANGIQASVFVSKDFASIIIVVPVGEHLSSSDTK
jgi:hypothetical protein